jgi:hypothetical protein
MKKRKNRLPINLKLNLDFSFFKFLMVFSYLSKGEIEVGVGGIDEEGE